MKIFKTLRLLLPLLVVTTVTYSCSSQGSQQPQSQTGDCSNVKSEKLNVDQFNQGLADAKDIILLDVRTADEFNAGHLDGAINIDFYSPNVKDEFSKLDKDKTVYIYCRSGGRSGKSAAILKDLCFKDVKDMEGGYMAWSGKGYKTVK